MKRTTSLPIVLFLLIAAALAVCSTAQNTRTWRTVEKTSAIWNGRGPVEFVLEIPTDHDAGGEYTRLRIRVPGEKEFAVTDSDGLVAFTGKDESVPKNIQRESFHKIKSKRLLMVGVNNETTLLFVIGYGYASSPGSLHVISLGKAGQPREILYKENLGFENAVDLDGDGRRELLVYPCLSEEYGSYLVSYGPMQVFKVGADGATYSETLSKAYNVKHYVWAGPDCTDQVAVLEVPGRKLQVFPKEEAERQDEIALKKYGKNKHRAPE